MKSINRFVSMLAVGALVTGLAGCMHAEDPLVPYIQRTGKITLSAGNAMAANAAIHAIDPWPRLSANRKIPANGQRMADTYERYRDVSKQPPRPIISPVQILYSSTAGGSGASAAK